MDCGMTHKKGGEHVAKDVHSQDKKGAQLRVILWVVIGILFIVALFLAFKVGAVNTVGTTLAANAAPASGGMVGGC